MLKYHDYIRTISQRFEARITEIAAQHNFDLGDEFEFALCAVLRAVLADRYGICRGHVIDSSGNEAGDDIIIFDRYRLPTLRMNAPDEFSRKEWIPIEAVYAYIEAKHTLSVEGNDKSSLSHAMNQAHKVKTICNRRRRVPPSEIQPYFDLSRFNNAIQVDPPDAYPDHRNPVFTAVMSRRIRRKSNDTALTDKNVVNELFLNRGFPAEIWPDLVVAGPNNLLVHTVESSTQPITQSLGSPFSMEGSKHPRSVSVDGIAFGIGVCQLMWALDWIQLGTMHWGEIVTDALNSESDS